MQFNYIIVGQGLCGTWLSYYLEKAGFSFIVIDESTDNSATKIAAGIINPVTGRRIVKTWMIDELLPFAKDAYMQMATELNLNVIEQKNTVDFFPTPQMKLAFNDRFSTDPSYLLNPADENNFRDFFNYDFGYGEIQPCYLINLPAILPAYRTKLLSEKKLLEEKFELSELSVLPDSISYKNISAQKIIFCDGIASFQNPFFSNLPFAPNKGEVIWIETTDLPTTHLFKKGMNLVPWTKNIFWIGSSYQWEFENNEPTHSFREQTSAQLKHWLKVPFKIIDHKAAVRPATLERRPFVGFHPMHSSIGILNGMGTKGCSLAPFFSNQLVEHLLHQTPIHAEASIHRFARILSRT
ncbi:MAG: NAD(P)/FAD-dependent oxidoreductase [Chitinophagaceae bacterium]